MKNPLKKSISQLEGWIWNIEIPVEDNSSYEEYNFYKLHDKKLVDYSLADIYFMTGQDTGFEYLIPMALSELEKDAFLMAEDYPSDLLTRVLKVSNKFWLENKKNHKRLQRIVKKNVQKIDSLDVMKDIKTDLKDSIQNFLKK